MPWSNQNGSGGNGQGPWGQGPRGPRKTGGGGGQPPDLEDIIRRSQDQLRNALPGGSGGGLIAIIVVIGLLLLWAFQAIYTVQPDERGVVLLFGKPKTEVSQPGLHFLWWPIERVEKVSIVEKQINIGGNSPRGAAQSLMLTGDQNIVDVQFSVLYSITNPQDYLFDVENPEDTLRQVAESAMREVVGRRPAQDIFRDNRQAIADSVKITIQETMDTYGAGISVNTVSIEDAAPPREVADAFDEVQRAEQDEDRFVEEANQYSNQQLGRARGEAAQIREEAAAYKNRVVNEAEGEAQRFEAIYEEYANAPDVTRKRLFLETLEEVYRTSNKFIVEQNGEQGVVPYLPLNELNKQKSQGGSN
ncbi:FtsH protease activity modulator HflK [Hoeflea sp. WL0058]|uniref:Protein HflK n=1 Tax=Flavimaribacter sediminis TaxID=2865987 RepID=A0AAE3CY57_9HYPH|nr:FtsH protease activity modulator HflK [Flavimaribacter sediminis]MBW8635810.1 FtsH protease activity modulator HflK [Flavimaribacter sediminis]